MTLQAWVSCYVWLSLSKEGVRTDYKLPTDLFYFNDLIIKYLVTRKFHTPTENFNTIVTPMKKKKLNILRFY